MKSRKNFKGEGLRISFVFITGSGGKRSTFLQLAGRAPFLRTPTPNFFVVSFEEIYERGGPDPDHFYPQRSTNIFWDQKNWIYSK